MQLSYGTFDNGSTKLSSIDEKNGETTEHVCHFEYNTAYQLPSRHSLTTTIGAISTGREAATANTSRLTSCTVTSSKEPTARRNFPDGGRSR
ncbi:MAG: hypothetical protein ACLR8Y_09840 [Alistipes indistinctus]